jgi:hypothetical protein
LDPRRERLYQEVKESEQLLELRSCPTLLC